MKTKIIYISGDENFNISDVRAAFEEVRKTIGLDDDTVLFGVSVDSDDAVGGKFESIKPTCVNMNSESEPKQQPDISEVAKPKRGRKKQTPVDTETDTPETIQNEANTSTNDTVVPILSVLGGGDVSQHDAEPEIVTEETIIISDVVSEPDNTDDVAPEQSTPDNTADVDDMITQDIPDIEIPVEKTLEELLESMAPLTEDEETEVKPENLDTNTASTDTTDDATLQQLATEFIANQDKINSGAKGSARSKIGKLKNILPFKKAKHDEGGIMGDLFGWAGVAANDDDFSVPGFLDLSNKNK